MAISDTYNCDCMGFMRGMPDKAFQLAIADPPYGIDINSSGRLVKEKGREYKGWDRQTPPQAFFDELLRVSRNVVIWGGNYFNLPPTRCFVVWDKGAGFAGRSYSECELAWTSFDRNAIMFRRDPLALRDYVGKIHPTQKPVALYAWLLRRFANKGDIIFDPMMGSQSSRIAAYHLGFDFVGCELDADYYREGCARFDRECMGETVCGGVKVKQLSLGYEYHKYKEDR